MSNIPDHVDVIVLGTGLTNSIIAAACSRIGKSVLHLDKNSYYGDDWASFTFQQLIDWIKIKQPEDESLKEIPKELINKSRMFCLDLAPRFLYSNGAMVDLLVKSNVARYHEFKNNIRILCMIGNDIHVLPCRRNEVFTSPLLSNLADKRRLMKFIELCVKFEDETGDGDSCEISKNAEKPIVQFLEERGLKSTMREYIINSIAMVRSNETTKEACLKIRKFMIATERYGRSPFLLPLYGCGEFPQSFCRLSAVFGGIYCLSTGIEDIQLPSSSLAATSRCRRGQTEKFAVKFSGLESSVQGDVLVMDYSYANSWALIPDSNAGSWLSRAILITNESIIPSGESENGDPVSFMRISPSESNTNLVLLLEFNSSALVCPKDLNIVYLWTAARPDGEPEEDLRGVIDRVFGEKSGRILWKFYYHQLMRYGNDDIGIAATIPSLHLTSSPSGDIDYEDSIKEAKRIFHLICPDQEFLPRAPDPEEIISC